MAQMMGPRDDDVDDEDEQEKNEYEDGEVRDGWEADTNDEYHDADDFPQTDEDWWDVAKDPDEE